MCHAVVTGTHLSSTKYLEMDKINNLNLHNLYFVANLSSETKAKEMDGIRGRILGIGMCISFYLEILKVRKRLRDLEVDRKLILKRLEVIVYEDVS